MKPAAPNPEETEDRPGALWTLKVIEADRLLAPPPFQRIVVGIDPAMTSGEGSDEWGIVCVGEGASPSGQEWPPHYNVLDDLSGRFTPNDVARCVVHTYRANQADRIAADVNNGGDLVEASCARSV